MIYASKSTHGFYDPEFNDYIPEDAVILPEGMHAELLAGQMGGKVINWDGELPSLQDTPLPTTEELNAIVIANREAAYRAEADPLFFQYQRDDIAKQVWLDKVTEIKTRFPKE